MAIALFIIIKYKNYKKKKEKKKELELRGNQIGVSEEQKSCLLRRFK
jgi:hypothetical protein